MVCVMQENDKFVPKERTVKEQVSRIQQIASELIGRSKMRKCPRIIISELKKIEETAKQLNTLEKL